MIARTRFAVPMLIALATVPAPAWIPSQGPEPLMSQDVGRLRGETVIRADGGGLIGRLDALVDFSMSTRTGTVVLHFAPARAGTKLNARANFSADSAQEGFGAVSALVAVIAGRATRGPSTLRLSQMRVEGDVSVLRTHADQIARWWDAQGEMGVDGYLSPVLILAHVARLQLNVWGTERAPHVADVHGYATLLFDPADPTVIIGGRLHRRNQDGSFTFQDLPAPFRLWVADAGRRYAGAQ